MTLTLPGDVELERVLELYEGFAEAGVPVRGGDTSSAGRIVVSVTALGRSDRVPGRAGARPGDQLVVTGPLGAAGAAFRDGRYVRPPLRTEEGSGSAPWRTRCSTSRTVSRSTRVTSPIAPAVASSIDLDAVPLAGELDDLGFGEDFELLAATPDPLGFTVIGRGRGGRGRRSCCTRASRTTCRATSTSV